MSIAKCPHCGQSIKLTKEYATAGWQLSQRFDSAVPAIATTRPAPQVTEAERRTPARPASVESDVMVPGAQALATGVALGIIAIPVSIYFQLHWTTPLTVLAIGTAGTWMSLLGAHRKLLWTVETIINRDIDGDGATGNPKPARVEVEVTAGRTTQLDDFPGPPEQLQKFANDVYSGRVTFSERGAGNSGYGATAFKELRKKFIARGWATWRTPGEARQGADLTAKGYAVMHGMADK